VGSTYGYGYRIDYDRLKTPEEMEADRRAREQAIANTIANDYHMDLQIFFPIPGFTTGRGFSWSLHPWSYALSAKGHILEFGFMLSILKDHVGPCAENPSTGTRPFSCQRKDRDTWQYIFFGTPIRVIAPITFWAYFDLAFHFNYLYWMDKKEGRSTTHEFRGLFERPSLSLRRRALCAHVVPRGRACRGSVQGSASDLRGADHDAIEHRPAATVIFEVGSRIRLGVGGEVWLGSHKKDDGTTPLNRELKGDYTVFLGTLSVRWRERGVFSGSRTRRTNGADVPSDPFVPRFFEKGGLSMTHCALFRSLSKMRSQRHSPGSLARTLRASMVVALGMLPLGCMTYVPPPAQAQQSALAAPADTSVRSGGTAITASAPSSTSAATRASTSKHASATPRAFRRLRRVQARCLHDPSACKSTRWGCCR